MRRLQKVAVLAIAVGSLSSMGSGVSAADPTAATQTQNFVQPPAAQVPLQQIGSTVHAPQQTTLQQAAPQQALAQAAPQQATTSQAPAQQAAPAQSTVQGLGYAVLPATARPAAQQTTLPQAVAQGTLQTSPQTVLQTSPQSALTAVRQAITPQVTATAATQTGAVAQTGATAYADAVATGQATAQATPQVVTQAVENAPVNVEYVFQPNQRCSSQPTSLVTLFSHQEVQGVTCLQKNAAFIG